MVSWDLALIKYLILFSFPRSLTTSLNMFSTSIIRQALASADVTHAVASAPSIPIRDGLGIPRMASGQISQTRKPRSDNAYAPSLLHPHILASKHLRCWVSGGPMLCSVKKGVAKLVPDESHRDKSEPVTLEHLHCLLRNLDLSNSKDTAVFSTSTAAFHGICRYCRPLYLCFIFPLRVLFRSSELCVPSHRLFDPSKHVSNSTCINFGTTPSGVH